MMRLHWRVVEGAAGLLGREDREAVLGDLVEAGEGAWCGLLDVLGLVVRRQVELWKSWRPWVAAVGVALPFSFLLMGFSVSVSLGYRQVMALHGGWGELVGRGVLLVVLAWASGFVVGAVSRRTLWVSVVATFSPCLFCLARFRIASLSRGCLLLFVLPAVLGVWRGLRGLIRTEVALVLAVGVTIGMGLWGAWWVNWFLVWPVWYLVVARERKVEFG